MKTDIKIRILLGIIVGFLISYVLVFLISSFVSRLEILPFAIGSFTSGYIIRKHGWLYGIAVSILIILTSIYIGFTISIANVNSIKNGIILHNDIFLDTLSSVCGSNVICIIYYFLKNENFFTAVIVGGIFGYAGELLATKRVRTFFQYPQLRKHFILLFCIIGVIFTLSYYDRYIKNRVRTIQKYERLALEQSVKKNYDEAIKCYKKALLETNKVLPENEYKYYREIGIIYYFFKKDYDNAIYYFEKAIKNYGRHRHRLDECYLYLGCAYHKKGKKKEAIKNLKMVEKVSVIPTFKRMAKSEIQRVLGIKKKCSATEGIEKEIYKRQNEYMIIVPYTSFQEKKEKRRN